MTRSFMMLALATTVIISAPATFAGEAAPRINENGLRRVADRHLDEVYVAPTAKLSGYRSIYVAPPSVSFREDWARDLNRMETSYRVRPEDVETLSRDYADLAASVFAETLVKHGFTLSDAPGEGVLVVRPDIVDLDIYAPDIQRAARVDRYSESSGKMTLSLTLADGASDQPLVQASDLKEDPRWGRLEWRTRPSNRADARRAMRSWADAVGDALNDGRWSG